MKALADTVELAERLHGSCDIGRADGPARRLGEMGARTGGCRVFKLCSLYSMVLAYLVVKVASVRCGPDSAGKFAP